MTVYRLEQIRWGNGLYSDFALPRVIGYFSALKSALAARDLHIAQMHQANGGMDPADETTDNDYTITTVEVR